MGMNACLLLLLVLHWVAGEQADSETDKTALFSAMETRFHNRYKHLNEDDEIPFVPIKLRAEE